MRSRVLWEVIAVSCLATAAGAQIRWRATVLHPMSAGESIAYAADGDLQGGVVEPEGGLYPFPALWSGSAETLVNLLPAGNWDRGAIAAMEGGRQVGQVLAGNNTQHAALWFGSADSFVDLHLSGLRASMANDISGHQVVGTAVPSGSGDGHAFLWDLNASTVTDLHPAAARWSRALATDGTEQGGWAQFPDLNYALHAVLWSGTSHSALDLNPFEAATSVINDMADGVQVGSALLGSQDIAVLWRGSPASAINMNPIGVVNSQLYATTGDIHGGSVRYASQWAYAAMWFSDDPNDVVTLHHAIPGNWKSSEIYSISVIGDTIYAAGAAVPSEAGTARAVVWVGTVPSPGAAGVIGATGAVGVTRRPRRVSRRYCRTSR